ncbi:hypothetical protein NMY22_g189 [Coprinellus aureogranulatus]|nr:hypothetical protein NMY22_g189 [Coprinellus aureogranulatus]
MSFATTFYGGVLGAWALIALDIIPPPSNRLAMPGQYQACIHSLPVTEMSTNHNVQILPGFFSQGIEIPSTDAGGVAQKATHTQSTLLTHTTTAEVEQVPPRFGLIDDSPDRWTKLRARISELNSSPSTRKEGENELGAANEVEPRAECKLILLVRHGEGYHNVAEAKYGTEAWDDYWSKLEGDGELVWGPDPLLTPKGISQARHTREVWEEELQYGLQPPCKIFCSPHSRALKTCEIVFEGYFENGRVTVVENCREENGVHTCDKRRPRSFIEANYPQFHIEDSLTEEDELWDPDVRETKAEVSARALGVIERIWEERPHDWFVAITAHSGFINGVLLALGSKPYPLPTGGDYHAVFYRSSIVLHVHAQLFKDLNLTPSTMDTDLAQRASNNDGPLEDELPRIRSLRQQCQATMEAIDEEIERLMIREAVGRDLKLCDLLLAPIRRVPADILSIIFHMASHIAIYADTPVEAHPNPPQIVPSQVCQGWRRLALDTPTLWSTICITPPAHPLVLDSDDLLGEMLPFAEGPWRNCMSHILAVTSLWIQRSQQTPLSVILKLSTASDGAHGRRHAPETSLSYYAALVELACGVSSRWQTLDLDVATDYPAILSTLIQITPDDVPQLRAIRFQTSSETRLGDLAHYPRGLLAGKALRTLTSVYFDKSVTDMCANWRGLTELRFGVEPGRKKMFGEIRSTIGKELQLRDALTLIHSCPNLRHCEIAVFESPLAGSLGSAEEPERRVRHRHLQSLRFHGYEPSQDLMKSVELPFLRHLELLSSFIGKLTIVDRLLLSSRFLFTINRFGCQLTSIRFNLLLLDNTSVVSQCFLNLRNLLNLELDSSAPTGQASPTRHTISDNFKRVATRLLTLLTRGMEAGTTSGGLDLGPSFPLCPKLQRFICAQLMEGFTESQLVDFITIRRDEDDGWGVAVLKEVYVSFSTPLELDIRDELRKRGVDTRDLNLQIYRLLKFRTPLNAEQTFTIWFFKRSSTDLGGTAKAIIVRFDAGLKFSLGLWMLLIRTIIMATQLSPSDGVDLTENNSIGKGSPELSDLGLPPLHDEAMAPSITIQSPFTQYLGTNYAPSDEEILVLRRLLGEYQKELDTLAYEFRKVGKASTIKISQRDAYLEAIDQHKALLSTIRRVPADILQEIFYIPLQELGPSISPHDISSAIHPSSSARLWGILKITCPVYRDVPRHTWPKRMNSLVEIVKLWTIRSGCYPIKLGLSNGVHEVHQYQVAEMAAAHSGYCQLVCALHESHSRWSDVTFSLYVSWATQPLLSILAPSPSNFARLGRAKVFIESSTLRSDPALRQVLSQAQQQGSLLTAASLRHLWLSGFWPGISLAPFTQSLPPLTSLRLRVWDPVTYFSLSDQELLRLLAAAPTLRHILFEGDLGEDTTLPHDPVPFLMPSLLSMRFHGYSFSPKFTPSFIAPRLQELQFHIGSDHQEMEFYDGIIECIQQFGKTTTTLAFSHNFVTRPVLVAILDCLPSLETLDLTPASLTGPRGLDEADESTDQIVLLELNGRSVRAVRCPKLRVLRLWVQDTYSSGTVVEEAVMRFLQERLKAAESGEVAYLQEVDILFHRPIEGDSMDFPGELASRGLYRGGLKYNLRYRG